MNEKTNNKEKRKIPVLSYEELLKKESGEIKFSGPYKIKEEDAEKALEYFKNR